MRQRKKEWQKFKRDVKLVKIEEKFDIWSDLAMKKKQLSNRSVQYYKGKCNIKLNHRPNVTIQSNRRKDTRNTHKKNNIEDSKHFFSLYFDCILFLSCLKGSKLNLQPAKRQPCLLTTKRNKSTLYKFKKSI